MKFFVKKSKYNLPHHSLPVLSRPTFLELER